MTLFNFLSISCHDVEFTRMIFLGKPKNSELATHEQFVKYLYAQWGVSKV